MLITRYLLKNVLAVAAFIALTLTMVIWLTQSLKLLELIANSDAPPGIFVKLVALSLPRFLEIIFPLSLVAAILFIYNKMIMDNELIVLRSCGFDQLTLARPALTLACCLTVILFLMSSWLSPEAHEKMQALRQNIKAQYSAFLLQEGVFNTFGDDLTVYLRKRSRDGDLLGLLIHDTRDKDKPPVTITAKRGRIVVEDDVPSIMVFDGLRQQMDTVSSATSRLYFSRYTIEIKGLESGGRDRRHEASERTLIELFNPDLTARYDILHQDTFRAEAHQRITTPFNALSFTLVSLVFILLGSFNRRGQNRKIIVAALTVTALQVLYLMAGNLSIKNNSFIPLMYAVTFLPIGISYSLLRNRGEQWFIDVISKWRSAAMTQEGAA
jgi:lipopolysaccharide export system permease protein